MTYPNSNSLIQSRINSGLSTSIIIKIGSITVGAVQSLTINQTREMIINEEIGNEGIIEIFPKNSARIDVVINRIVFDELNLPEAFGRGFVNLQAQRIPFDIHLVDVSRVDTESNFSSTIIHNCWFKSYNTPFSANSYIITETANIAAEYITSMRDGQNIALGGLRGLDFENDSIERNTDLIGRRGRFFSTNELNQG